MIETSTPVPPCAPAVTFNQDDYAGNAGDVLKHAIWGLVLEAASFDPREVGILETHCGLPERDVLLDERRAHLALPLAEGDGGPSMYYAEVLRARLSVRGTFARVPGSLALTARAIGDRRVHGRRTFGVFTDRDPSAVRAIVEELRAGCEGATCQLCVHDAFDDESIATLGERIADCARTNDERLLVALVDPFRYAPAGSDDPLDALPVTLHERALVRWMSALATAGGAAPDLVVAAWIYDHGEAACAAMKFALEARGLTPFAALARIEAEGRDYGRYRLAIVGAGREGARIAELVLTSPWAASPTLRAWGFRIVVEAR
jgi:hypothetical protein